MLIWQPGFTVQLTLADMVQSNEDMFLLSHPFLLSLTGFVFSLIRADLAAGLHRPKDACGHDPVQQGQLPARVPGGHVLPWTGSVRKLLPANLGPGPEHNRVWLPRLHFCQDGEGSLTLLRAIKTFYGLRFFKRT